MDMQDQLILSMRRQVLLNGAQEEENLAAVLPSPLAEQSLAVAAKLREQASGIE